MHSNLLHNKTISSKHKSGSICLDDPSWFLQQSCGGTSIRVPFFECTAVIAKRTLHLVQQWFTSLVSKHQRVAHGKLWVCPDPFCCHAVSLDQLIFGCRSLGNGTVAMVG